MRARSVFLVASVVAAASVAAAAPAGPSPAPGSDASAPIEDEQPPPDEPTAAGTPIEATPDEPTPDEPAAAAAQPAGPPLVPTPIAPPPSAAALAAPVVAPPAPRAGGFRFGSYGRVLAGTDLRGGRPEAVRVVGIGPRIVEPTYVELDLGYDHATRSGRRLRTVATLAFADALFHDTGEFDAQPALRNLYAEGDLGGGASAWIGARMYRGDDVYLLDLWPVDDQNTVGGGARWQRGALDVRAHVGWNRLRDPFQFQEIDVANPQQGATTVTQLNRQRTVASTTVGYVARAPAPGAWGLRAMAHAELHRLPAGERERDDGTLEALPRDGGVLLGAQLTAWQRDDAADPATRQVMLFARLARGLAAFDELRPPTSFGADLTTDRASELMLGASGNWDHRLGSVTAAWLTRRFVDADRATADLDDAWEHVLVARPRARVPGLPDAAVALDLSYQVRFARGANPTTGLIADAAVTQIAPMLLWSPTGSSAYARPELRLVYRAAHQNQGARDAFVPDDPRGDRAWVHYLGVAAEWWFQSSTYAR